MANMRHLVNFKKEINSRYMSSLSYFNKAFSQYSLYRSPNGMKLVQKIVEDRNGYNPCGRFNKDNSCDLSFVHSNDKNENIIHSCALCYFALSGLINIHRLPKCPLLSYVDTK